MPLSVETVEKASMAVAGTEERRGRRCRCSLLAELDEIVGEETATLVMSARRRESERVDGKSTTGPDNLWVAAAVLEEDSAMLD